MEIKDLGEKNMRRLDEIGNLLAQHKEELAATYKVKEIGIFGSYTKGEKKKKSDVDILVEFKEPIGFFEFMDLEEYFENLLETKVDLVSKKR